MQSVLVSTTRKPSIYKTLYGAVWDAKATDIEIELSCVRAGGTWKNRRKQVCGKGLAYHALKLQGLLWPELDDHRWHRLCQETIAENQVTVLMGPGSSGKTHEAAKLALMDYFVAPEETIILVSSTDLRGLELRVWGEIKKLFKMARARFPWIPGHLVDSKHCISTDDIEDEDEIRDMRNGIVGVPCVVNQKFVGLGKYVGIKNKRVRLIADEAQFMEASFLDAISNLEKNPDFKAVILGNPIDPMDSLGKSAEPIDGWASLGEPEKTTVWQTRFKNGKCVNLVGTDSPNFDFPKDQPPRYPYLIHQGSIDSTASFYGTDSLQYYSQCKGVMKTGLVSRRVISRRLCEQFKASEPAVWGMDYKRTRIYALDAAYGNIGGDRCVGGYVEFGKDIDNGTTLLVNPPVIVPVSIRNPDMPEDQIASYVKQECENLGIPPEFVYFDATGRGSLGTSFARIWSAFVNPVEFGGNPTDRPVCQDMYVIDPKTKVKRLKLCSEHFSKFVTELWFEVRYVIEAGQMKGLPRDVMEEGCMREWKMVKGFKIEIETKEEMKERMGRSPDLFDWLATAVEGARRRGFQIGKLSINQPSTSSFSHWAEKMKSKMDAMNKRTSLTYS